MIMDNLTSRIEDYIVEGSSSFNTSFSGRGRVLDNTPEEIAKSIVVKLLTPKLQWKSEEISCDGGNTLLATVYSVTNYHTSIQVYDPVNGTASVNWNGNLVFEGALEECKQFCSDKILNDFLKLCE